MLCADKQQTSASVSLTLIMDCDVMQLSLFWCHKSVVIVLFECQRSLIVVMTTHSPDHFTLHIQLTMLEQMLTTFMYSQNDWENVMNVLSHHL